MYESCKRFEYAKAAMTGWEQVVENLEIQNGGSICHVPFCHVLRLVT